MTTHKQLAQLLRWLRDPAEFGRTVKSTRLRLGMGMRELARELGLTQPTIVRVEAGRRMTTTTFEPLATWLLATGHKAEGKE